MRALLAGVLAAAALLAGCGSTAAIVGGGSVPGTARTVYSVLPHPGEGAARDIVLGQKLALQEAGGTAGPYAVSFVSLDESTPDPALVAEHAGVVAEQVIRDPQVIAVIGFAGSAAARTAIPLIDAAGILHLLPGAGYAGFTEPGVAPGEPARWFPSGSRDDLVRLVPDDHAQARALAKAARGRRVAVEHEPDAASEALAAAVEDALQSRVSDDPAAADAVVYAGEDAGNAAAVAESAAAEGAAIVLPDAVVRAGVADRLSPRARRRAVLVSAAPAPGSAAVRELTPRFEAAFGRPPGPYAVIGYEAMRAVVAAIDEVGGSDRRRSAVTRAFEAPPQRPFTTYRP
jgi:branched-chain amino acid transport system substrate-binding protein